MDSSPPPCRSGSAQLILHQDHGQLSPPADQAMLSSLCIRTMDSFPPNVPAADLVLLNSFCTRTMDSSPTADQLLLCWFCISTMDSSTLTNPAIGGIEFWQPALYSVYFLPLLLSSLNTAIFHIFNPLDFEHTRQVRGILTIFAKPR